LNRENCGDSRMWKL